MFLSTSGWIARCVTAEALNGRKEKSASGVTSATTSKRNGWSARTSSVETLASTTVPASENSGWSRVGLSAFGPRTIGAQCQLTCTLPCMNSSPRYIRLVSAAQTCGSGTLKPGGRFRRFWS